MLDLTREDKRELEAKWGWRALADALLHKPKTQDELLYRIDMYICDEIDHIMQNK
jgi:hypothetical protein